MPKTSTSFKPGKSGNPKGRPPKSRALTEILKRSLNKTTQGSDGRRIARKRMLADQVAEFVTTGAVTMPDGKLLIAEDIGDWLTAVKWLYRHIDGEAPKQVEHGGVDGSDIEVVIRYADD